MPPGRVLLVMAAVVAVVVLAAVVGPGEPGVPRAGGKWCHGHDGVQRLIGASPAFVAVCGDGETVEVPFRMPR